MPHGKWQRCRLVQTRRLRQEIIGGDHAPDVGADVVVEALDGGLSAAHVEEDGDAVAR